MKRTIGKRSIIAWVVIGALLPVFSVWASASTEFQTIKDMRILEDANSISVVVQGAGTLNYVPSRQHNPPSLQLYFGNTLLSVPKTELFSDNAVVRSVKASQQGADGRTVKVEIDLKQNTVPDYIRNGAQLRIRFAKTAGEKVIRISDSGSVASRNPARKLQGVWTLPPKDGYVKLFLEADGPITRYESSVSDRPARIIFDLYDVKSPYSVEKMVPVETPWVKRVRYYGYPDRLRVTLDTKSEYLNQYSADPIHNGLLIRIGRTDGKPAVYTAGSSSSKAVSSKRSERSAPKISRVEDSSGATWIDRIDFVGEQGGKSTLIIGSTRPLSYEMEKIGSKRLRLQVNNAKIPAYRQRPLITDRFESAVDDIRPIQKPRAGHSDFTIDLREEVPYHVEQTGNLLMVHFEASSVSPKPSAVAALPEWGTVLESGVAQVPSSGNNPESLPDPTVLQSEPVLSAATPSRIGSSEMPSSIQLSSAGDSDPFSQIQTKKYTGEKIALDFFKTDIKNVFRILREISGLNFAIEKDVKGEVTLTLDKPVPWDQVLDLILKMNRLGKTIEGDIIRIATQNTLAKEDADRKKRQVEEQQLQEAKKSLEPLFTEYIPVNYSSAGSEIKPHIDKILTKDRGTVSVDARTNMVIITDTKEKIRQALEIVEKLDRVTPQVIIEARIVEVTSSFNKEFGVDWAMDSGINNSSTAAGQGPQRSYDVLGGTYGYGMAMNYPNSSAGSGFNFDFMRIAGTPFLLEAKLRAMESNSEGKIISAPKILTLDNKSAQIKQGVEIPYAVTDKDGNTSVQFKNVDLLLNVTPHITPDNRISIKLSITKNDTLPGLYGGVPGLTTKEANTELLINDGDTIVIGGIKKSNYTYSESGFPGLSKIPLIGWLFKNKSDRLEDNELMIFLTTRIVQLEQKMLSK